MDNSGDRLAWDIDDHARSDAVGLGRETKEAGAHVGPAGPEFWLE